MEERRSGEEDRRGRGLKRRERGGEEEGRRGRKE